MAEVREVNQSLRITLCQVDQQKNREAKWVEELLTGIEDDLRPDVLVFPEGFMTYKQVTISPDVEPFVSLGQVARKFGVALSCGTIREHVEKGKSAKDATWYQTAVYINKDGKIASSYRQMGVHTSHPRKALGSTPVSFQAVQSVNASTLICIDVEYPDIWNATMDTNPVVLFNPCHIILYENEPATQFRIRENAVKQFAKKYEEYCHRLGLIMVRCDNPFETASMGSSQIITPNCTLVPPSGMEGCYTIDIPLQDNFYEHFRKTDEMRSRRDDNIGTRIQRYECILHNAELGKVRKILCRAKPNVPSNFIIYTLFVLRECGLQAFARTLEPWTPQDPCFTNPSPEDPLICFDTNDLKSNLMVCSEKCAYILAAETFEILEQVEIPQIRGCFAVENGFVLIADCIYHISDELELEVLLEDSAEAFYDNEDYIHGLSETMMLSISKKSLVLLKNMFAQDNVPADANIERFLCSQDGSIWQIHANQMKRKHDDLSIVLPDDVTAAEIISEKNAGKKDLILGGTSRGDIFICGCEGFSYKVPGFECIEGDIRCFASRNTHIWAVKGDCGLILLETSYNAIPKPLTDCLI